MMAETDRFSRLKVYVCAAIISTLANATASFLTPDTPYLLPIFVLITGVIGGALSLIVAAIAHALFADVVDCSRLKTRVDGAGLYLFVSHSIGKAEKVLLGSIGLVIVGLFGFQPGAALFTIPMRKCDTARPS